MARLLGTVLLSLLAARSPVADASGSLQVRDSTSAPKCPPGPGKDSHKVVNDTGSETWPYQTYQSAAYQPPVLQITRNCRPLAPGLLLFSPEPASPERGSPDLAPLIMTDDGQLVWNGPAANATNFRVASYKKNSILTYWNGVSTEGVNIGHGYGNVTFLDTSYNTILVVCPKLGLVTPDNVKYQCEADIHESFVTDQDTLIVSAYNVTQADLTSVGGPKDGWIFDSLFFELDTSGNILFKWSPIEHVPVSQTKFPIQSTGKNQSVPFDYFHINSIVNVGTDHYLVNSRHCWTTYLVHKNGSIVWTLEGQTGGDFGTLPANGQFAWQHYARPQPQESTSSQFTISYFNNLGAYPVVQGNKPSTGLKLSLPLPPSKSKPPVVLEYLSDRSQPLFAGSQGSRDTLPNQNIFMDYGQLPILKEYGPGSPSGKDVRWTAQFGGLNLIQSYRGFKSEWHATPSTKPNLVVISGHDKGQCGAGYVSWNGATDVQGWMVLEGPTKQHLSQAGVVPFRGFETSFTVGGQACVQVKAVGKGEKQIPGGSSQVVCH